MLELIDLVENSKIANDCYRGAGSLQDMRIYRKIWSYRGSAWYICFKGSLGLF